MTLAKIENGAPTAAIGHYIQVLLTLGLERDILKPLTKEKISHMVNRIIVDEDLRKGNSAPRSASADFALQPPANVTPRN